MNQEENACHFNERSKEKSGQCDKRFLPLVEMTSEPFSAFFQLNQTGTKKARHIPG
jgi:hypothetical protein